MKKKIIKYTSRIVLGLFTLFGGLATWVAFHHSMDEYPCEAGQEDMNPKNHRDGSDDPRKDVA